MVTVAHADLFPSSEAEHARPWTAAWGAEARKVSQALPTIAVQVGDLDEVPALPPAGLTPIDQHDDDPERGRDHGGGPQRHRVDGGDLESHHRMRQDVARL